ncbi:MAG TPA: DUF1330 domain-containing protein [Rhodothermales bacterium]|nr:DUF1330 domain-containing protein [Rhodothermales bacterium]
MSDTRVRFLVQLWLKRDDRAAFEAFERRAAAVMQKHGGRVDYAFRPAHPTPDTPFEIHLVSFPNAEAFAAYRADPETQALSDEREAIIARTVVYEVDKLPAYLAP